MNVVIFGASGRTGHELVRQALTQGDFVTAFVRDPAKLMLRHDDLKVIQGAVEAFASVDLAINQQDAVVCALGAATPFKRDRALIEGVRNIIKAMERRNVKRLVYLSFLGVQESRKDSGFLINHVLAALLHKSVADHEEKENLIKASPLDWTIVRPPKLTNGRRKGKYRSGEDIRPNSFIPTISRADLAEFMLRQLTEHTYSRKAARIMY